MHPFVPDHGRFNFTVGVTLPAAIGTPKPKPPRGRPSLGGLAPAPPRPGLGDFGKPTKYRA